MGNKSINSKARSRLLSRSWSVERRQAFLQSVGDLFLRDGYAGVSLERVISTTGGSLRDIYREFGDKDALFSAVLELLCDEVLAPLRRLQSNGKSRKSIEQALIGIGTTYLRSLLSDRILALHRLIISESQRFPHNAVQFYQLGPESAHNSIADIFEELAQKHGLPLADKDLAAILFTGMLTGDLQLKALTGKPVALQEVKDRVGAVVKMFLINYSHHALHTARRSVAGGTKAPKA